MKIYNLDIESITPISEYIYLGRSKALNCFVCVELVERYKSSEDEEVERYEKYYKITPKEFHEGYNSEDFDILIKDICDGKYPDRYLGNGIDGVERPDVFYQSRNQNRGNNISSDKDQVYMPKASDYLLVILMIAVIIFIICIIYYFTHINYVMAPQ